MTFLIGGPPPTDTESEAACEVSSMIFELLTGWDLRDANP
jgi:hypothetical protein